MINLMAMHNQRFFSYLSLFTFFMLILVAGGNFFVLFVGWFLAYVTNSISKITKVLRYFFMNTIKILWIRDRFSAKFYYLLRPSYIRISL